MGVTLRSADRHSRGGGDLLEREAERILEDENVRLGGGKGREPVTKSGAKLRELGLTIGRRPLRRAGIVVEKIVVLAVPPKCDVPARVQRQTMKPRREGGLAAELAELHTQLGESLLSCVARVFSVAEDVMGEPFDPRSMALAERLEGASVAVLRTPDENRVA